jgi:hypothetical protein
VSIDGFVAAAARVGKTLFEKRIEASGWSLGAVYVLGSGSKWVIEVCSFSAQSFCEHTCTEIAYCVSGIRLKRRIKMRNQVDRLESFETLRNCRKEREESWSSE